MPRVPQQQQKGTSMEEIIKKGAWSSEEDQKLRAYIMKYGIWNWRQMPKFAGPTNKTILLVFDSFQISYDHFDSTLSSNDFSDKLPLV